MFRPLSLSILVGTAMFVAIEVHAQSIDRDEAKKITASLATAKQDSSLLKNLLILAQYHILKPGENKADLDSAAGLISRAALLNKELHSTMAEGNIIFVRSLHLKESGQRDQSRELAAKAVAMLKRGNDKDLTGQAYMELASYYNYDDAGELAERIELTRSAVNSYAESGNVQQKAASLQMLGDLYNIKGSSYVALQHLQAALDAYNSINYRQVQGIYCLMGFIYLRLREYPLALGKQLLALKTAEAAGDSSMQLCQIYNYLGEIQNALTEREKAIFYYDKALKTAERHNDQLAIYIASVNIANTWAALNQPHKALDLMKSVSARFKKPKDRNLNYNIARCYIISYCLLKQFEKARPYARQLLQMIDDLKLSDYASISHYTIAIRFFIAAHEYGEALKYLEKHGELAGRQKDLYHLGTNQKLRFMMDTSRHDLVAAVGHLLAFNNLNDSLNIQRKNRQIEELQVQFETEKKEHAIAAKDKDIQLLHRQTQLQQSRIENSRLMGNFMVAAAVLLLLILVLVYNRYTVKKKSNRALSKQQAQINAQNHSLQTMVGEQKMLIEEKEWLLKEIHHRVKNNLQIVMSLLNTQSAFIDDEPALAAIHESRHRVYAMSLIHQKLYNTENVSSINISLYISELVCYLADSFNVGQRIRFESNIEPLEMDVSQSVPLGLILNEAITNSIKYAFPGGKQGIIFISLARTAPDRCLLTVSDNGTGMPAAVNDKKHGSMGMSMMKGLSRDLDGQFSIETKNGVTIKISFAYKPGVKHHGILIAPLVSNN